MMKQCIIIIWLLTVGACLSTFANNNDIYQKQRLINELDTTSNDTLRLRLLYDLSSLTVSQPEERQIYVDKMLFEAERQNNNKYKCEAYLANAIIAHNNYDTIGVSKWTSLVEPLARKEKLYECLFLSKYCELNMLLIQGLYELQEQKSQKILQEAIDLNYPNGIVMAYQSMAYGYHFTYRNKKAIEVLEKAYKYLSKCNNDDLSLNLINTLIIISENEKDTFRWLKYLKAKDILYQKMADKNPDSTESLRCSILANYISYMNYYTYIKDWANAEKALKTTEQYYSDQYSPIHKQNYRLSRYEYYKQIKDTDKALQEIDSALVIMQSLLNINYFNTLTIKAQLLSLTGNDKEALAIFKQTIASKDSLNLVILSKQNKHIKDSYNADQLLLENLKLKRHTQLVIFIPIFLLAIVLIIFAIHFYKIGLNLHKAKKEMGKMAYDVEQANIAKEKFLANISSAINKPLDIVVNNSLLLSSDAVISKEEKESLSILINKTSSELMNLINDILILSKQEANVMKYNVGTLEILTHLRIIAETSSLKTGIPIDITFPQNIEYEIEIDLNYFSQMINSMFETTAEYCDRITLSQEATGSNTLQITIEGTGLATKTDKQELVIRNEINRMLVEHFGGRYEIHSNKAKPYISLTFPIIRIVNL